MTGQPTLSQRIYSIDILRGLIMVVMALDHVRDFFHITASTDSPTNLATTTVTLFFTRWITHYCAPVFVFLAGVSAYLSGLKKTRTGQGNFLIRRGVWLVFIEVTVVSFAWTFDPLFHIFILQVIWAIGISMIILGVLIRFISSRAILATGLFIICFHNLLDYPESRLDGHIGLFWNLVHHGNFVFVRLFDHRAIFIAYAFLPWTGIMLAGYGAGRLFSTGFSSAERKKILWMVGGGLVLLFIVLRFMNGYGDPTPWKLQRTPVFSFLSFLNVNKYPPSLEYAAMTLGPALIMLALLESAREKSFSFFTSFGRVPFFFYVLHLYLIHLAMLVIFVVMQFPAKDIVPQFSPFYFRPDYFGYPLWIVYLIWAVLIVVAYPLCRWYGRYKATHRSWWLSYL